MLMLALCDLFVLVLDYAHLILVFFDLHQLTPLMCLFDFLEYVRLDHPPPPPALRHLLEDPFFIPIYGKLEMEF